MGTRSRVPTSKREPYGRYLAALSLATHQSRDLWRPGPLAAGERVIDVLERAMRADLSELD